MSKEISDLVTKIEPIAKNLMWINRNDFIKSKKQDNLSTEMLLDYISNFYLKELNSLKLIDDKGYPIPDSTLLGLKEAFPDQYDSIMNNINKHYSDIIGLTNQLKKVYKSGEKDLLDKLLQDTFLDTLLKKDTNNTHTLNSMIQKELLFKGRKLYGREHQESKIQNPPENIVGYDISQFSKGKYGISGDIASVINKINNKTTRIVVADACGKGEKGALEAGLIRYPLEMDDSSPKDVLFKTNNYVAKKQDKATLTQDNSLGHSTAFVMDLYPSSGKAIYASAGHEVGFIYNSDGTLDKELPATGIALSFFENSSYKEKEINIKKGQFLILYSDGVTELVNRNINARFEDRLEKSINQYLSKNQNTTSQGLMNYVTDQMKKFVNAGISEELKGKYLFDDTTLLIIKRE